MVNAIFAMWAILVHRSLDTRVKEHQYAIRSYNITAKHSIETGHLPDLKNTKILGQQEHDLKSRRLLK